MSYQKIIGHASNLGSHEEVEHLRHLDDFLGPPSSVLEGPGAYSMQRAAGLKAKAAILRRLLEREALISAVPTRHEAFRLCVQLLVQPELAVQDMSATNPPLSCDTVEQFSLPFSHVTTFFDYYKFVACPDLLLVDMT